MQPGDVPSMMADVSELESAVGFRPVTTIREGIERFVDWYKDYHRIPGRRSHGNHEPCGHRVAASVLPWRRRTCR